MKAIRLQFILSFGVYGSVVPFLSAFLERERGLSHGEVGFMLGICAVAMLFTPPLMAFLADRWGDSRRLLAAMFIGTGVVLVALRWTHEPWQVAALLVAYHVILAPMASLQDAVAMSHQATLTKAGEKATPYHVTRVFGTLGFILPSLAMYWLQGRGFALDAAFAIGATYCLLGTLNSARLPRPEALEPKPASANAIPTAAALRSLLAPGMPVFALASFLVNVAATAFYTYFAIFLIEEVRLDAAWIGPIFNLGVAVEILFVLSFGWLVRRLGMRNVVLLSAGVTMLRFGILFFWPTTMAILLSQVLHGPLVLLVNVVPVLYVNAHARQEFRSSAQGVFNVLVPGLARVVGNLTGAWVAGRNLPAVFLGGAVLCAVATALFHFGMRPTGKGRGHGSEPLLGDRGP